VKAGGCDAREVRTAEDPDLAGHRLEHVGRRCPLRHQRSHATQRGLLIDEPPHLRPRLGVRDRHRHQLRERREACLGIQRQGLLLAGAGGHQAPQAAFDEDRRPDGRADALVADTLGELAGRIAIVVEPDWTARLRHKRGEVPLAPDGPPAANREPVPCTGDERDRAVGLVAAHVRQVDRKQPSDSFATAANTFSGRVPRATSVATRRSAACSSASLARLARFSVFEIAVATSSASRSSIWSGSGSRLLAAAIQPQISPSTMIGAPADPRSRASRPAAAIVPGSSV
jgi:hypothetical protein